MLRDIMERFGGRARSFGTEENGPGSDELEEMAHPQPCRLPFYGADVGATHPDGNGDDYFGKTAAANIIEFGVRKLAIGGILCVAHFSLHARKSDGPFRHHQRGDF